MTRSFEVGSRAFDVVARAFDPTLFTALTVDDYNDETLTEYSESLAGEYGFETTSPIEGAASLTRTGTDGYEELVSTSGLANYPSKGSVIETQIRCPLDSGDSGNTQIGPIFGAADLTNWYSARFDAVQDDFEMFVQSDAGGQVQLAADNALGGFYTAGDVLVIEVTWDDGTYGGSDNDIVARLMDSTRTTVHAELGPVNDATHEANSGVGCESYNDTAGNEPVMDQYRIVG